MAILTTQSVQGLPTIISRPLRPFFEKVIDKKVNRVAVGILNRFVNLFVDIVNCLCTKFYAAYRKRLKYRLNEKKLSIELNALQGSNQDLSIAISIIGGARLYDYTIARCITVNQAAGLILVNAQSVRFCTNTGLEDIHFGVARQTQAIVITDILNLPGWIRIKEQQMSGKENVWYVDINQLLPAQVMKERTVVGFDEYYMALDEHPLAAR